MDVPAHFAASDEDVAALLDGTHLVDLISPTADGLIATPLPMLLDGTSLLGHVARNNPHWRASVAGESMVIAHGPAAYVSPSWYAAKREHGRVVPQAQPEPVGRGSRGGRCRPECASDCAPDNGLTSLS
jgi:transcriptional regulator